MNLFFWRRPLHDFAQGIQPELRALRTPEPTAQLLERILESRARGARIILPEPPAIATRGRRVKRLAIAASIAAALLLVAVPLQRRGAADDVASGGPFFGPEAFAQTEHGAGSSRL